MLAHHEVQTDRSILKEQSKESKLEVLQSLFFDKAINVLLGDGSIEDASESIASYKGTQQRSANVFICD